MSWKSIFIRCIDLSFPASIVCICERWVWVCESVNVYVNTSFSLLCIVLETNLSTSIFSFSIYVYTYRDCAASIYGIKLSSVTRAILARNVCICATSLFPSPHLQCYIAVLILCKCEGVDMYIKMRAMYMCRHRTFFLSIYFDIMQYALIIPLSLYIWMDLDCGTSIYVYTYYSHQGIEVSRERVEASSILRTNRLCEALGPILLPTRFVNLMETHVWIRVRLAWSSAKMLIFLQLEGNFSWNDKDIDQIGHTEFNFATLKTLHQFWIGENR